MCKTCETCENFNPKSDERGECLCVEARDLIHITFIRVEEIFNHPKPNELTDDLQKYADIRVHKDFGCRFHQ